MRLACSTESPADKWPVMRSHARKLTSVPVHDCETSSPDLIRKTLFRHRGILKKFHFWNTFWSHVREKESLFNFSA